MELDLGHACGRENEDRYQWQQPRERYHADGKAFLEQPIIYRGSEDTEESVDADQVYGKKFAGRKEQGCKSHELAAGISNILLSIQQDVNPQWHHNYFPSKVRQWQNNEEEVCYCVELLRLEDSVAHRSVAAQSDHGDDDG